jgi:hypothetical protein
MSVAVDNRQVVLLKSRRTNNRFYTLVDPESGFRNADAIDEFPEHLPFRDDTELLQEMMGIIADSRGNLVRRLKELRDRIVGGQAHFLGTDLQEFKDHVVHMATRGTIRRQLDSMMKVDVFESVSKTEAGMRGGAPEPMYRYELLPDHSMEVVGALPPRTFIGRVFDDILDAVNDDANYSGKYTFDKHVFQKFIAVMFVNYATTDPLFYGTNPKDYGVSLDKDMAETPLYQAVATALRELERGWDEEGREPGAPEPEEGRPEGDLSFLFQDGEQPPDFLQGLEQAGHTVEIPFGAGERMLLDPLTRLADALRLLQPVDNPREMEARRIAGAAGRQIFRALQELKIISPLASDPLEGLGDDG